MISPSTWPPCSTAWTHAALLFLLATVPPSVADSDGFTNQVPVDESWPPHIFLAILSRNSAHLLPNFFGYVDRLDYPKGNISVWIRTDHNSDGTADIIEEWIHKVTGLYRSVDFFNSEEWLYPNFDPFMEHEEKYLHVAQLKQEGLETARQSGADYLLWLDCDNFIVNNSTIYELLKQDRPIVAPMLRSGIESAYSNFWCGMTEKGYYKRTLDYIPILDCKKEGCFKVPVVNSAVLINLKWAGSEMLRYWPAMEGFNGPTDEVTHLAYSALKLGLGMYILNTAVFGYMIKPEEYTDLQDATNKFLDFKLENLVNSPPVIYSDHVHLERAYKDNVGLDAVFMIGLARRPERRNRMIACLDELDFDYTLFDAVDGRQLNQSYIDSLGIKYLSGWKDPWGERPMTFGEVGCFLSHHTIWQKMLTDNLQEILVLEDDVVFEPNFRADLLSVLKEAHRLVHSWDLIYVGRKALYSRDEQFVTGADKLVRPRYSYWTLGYLLSQRGARKLVEGRPFEKMLPVDEYLPIMFDTHPEKEWAAHFSNRNLETYSTHPLLVHPTHYIGDDGWFSDTEPPMEVLNQIRARKKVEEQKESAQLKNESNFQKKIREQAVQRQIETLKQKLKEKTEL